MLSPEDQERVVARLEGREIEEPQEQLEAEPELEEQHEEEPEDSLEEEETQVEFADSEEDDEEYSGHAVPYDRFRQVNERRKHLQSEIEQRDLRLQQLQDQLNQRYQQAERAPEPSYEYETEYSEADPNEWAQRFQQVETANQQMQIQLAQMDLQREINDAVSQFPSVPEDYLWESIAQNGDLSAVEAAQQYTNFVAGIEEAAIARYLETQQAEAPQAAPRPQSQQTVGTEYLEDAPAPRTLEEAREAMVMYLNS